MDRERRERKEKNLFCSNLVYFVLCSFCHLIKKIPRIENIRQIQQHCQQRMIIIITKSKGSKVPLCRLVIEFRSANRLNRFFPRHS